MCEFVCVYVCVSVCVTRSVCVCVNRSVYHLSAAAASLARGGGGDIGHTSHPALPTFMRCKQQFVQFDAYAFSPVLFLRVFPRTFMFDYGQAANWAFCGGQ